MQVLSSSYQLLPTYTGVYIFSDKNGKIIYVGKAKNLKNRVSSYFKSKNLGRKTSLLVAQIYKIKIIPVNSETEAFLLEEKLIKKYKPKYNLKLQDDKAFQSIKITIKDQFPKVLLTRKVINDGSIYFGPYTDSTALKSLLKTIRKIFPFQNTINHPNKTCFYFHLNLCPCPIATDPKEYKKTIKYIINFLKGDIKKIIKNLSLQRDLYSKALDFENAKIIQQKINAINNLTVLSHTPFEYENNPNLKFDILEKELTDLKKILNTNDVKVKSLKRIECFDISNISGIFATGAMVVFLNGEKNQSLYKRFRIKKDYHNKPNDFLMMEEVLERRLKRIDWQYPSLIILDGGKGQVSTINKLLNKLNIEIPLIGLAKKEETIITSNLEEIRLDKDQASLHLVMRIRDEAHRFAINYHKKLRSKLIFS